jgi:predicted nucleic acid-binding protein
MQIAAAAIAIDAQLVTNNKKHFDKIEGLKIANWTKEASLNSEV